MRIYAKLLLLLFVLMPFVSNGQSDTTQQFNDDFVFVITPKNPKKTKKRYIEQGETLKVTDKKGKIFKGPVVGVTETHLYFPNGQNVAFKDMEVVHRISKDLAARVFGGLLAGGGFLMYKIDNRNNGRGDKKNNNSLVPIFGGAIIALTKHGSFDSFRFSFSKGTQSDMD